MLFLFTFLRWTVEVGWKLQSNELWNQGAKMAPLGSAEQPQINHKSSFLRGRLETTSSRLTIGWLV